MGGRPWPASSGRYGDQGPHHGLVRQPIRSERRWRINYSLNVFRSRSRAVGRRHVPEVLDDQPQNVNLSDDDGEFRKRLMMMMMNYSCEPPPCQRARGQKTGPVGDPVCCLGSAPHHFFLWDYDGGLRSKRPPTPCLWQAPTSAQKTERKTWPAAPATHPRPGVLIPGPRALV